MGSLYLVSTPIGNLDDTSFRAVEVLKRVGLIAAEDTRVTRKLLNHFEIQNKLISYHEFSELTKMDEVLAALSEGDVALVSDAGTPGISDPGYKLIREVIRRDIKVVPLPGPSACVSALIASGLPTDKFMFLGFLPKKSSGRVKFLSSYKDLEETLVMYESPYRLTETLADMYSVFGERSICVAREISKKFEEFIRLELSQAVEILDKMKIAGEITLVVEGKREVLVWDKYRVRDELKELVGEMGLNKAAKEVAKRSGWGKSEIYKMGLDDEN